MKLSRRGMAGVAAAAGLAGLAGLRFSGVFAPHYAPTPYDDLLGRLVDREQAARLGAAVLKDMPGFRPEAQASLLRRGLGARSLAAVAGEEAVQGRLRDVGGWLVPESVARLSALAAKAQAAKI